MDEFSHIILGDEPAGLWLANRLYEEHKEAGVSCRIGWLSFEAELPPVCLPVRAAGPFAIPVKDDWSAEIVTPERSLSWDEETLKREFPELTVNKSTGSGFSKPSSSYLSSIRHAIRNHPELLSFAAGVWKYLGRTDRLQPETLVSSALACERLMWWSPEDDLPAQVKKIRLSVRDNPIEEVKNSRQGTVLHFRGLPPIAAHKWVLNTSVRRLTTLSSISDVLIRLLNNDIHGATHYALYPLSLRLETDGMPNTLRPLSFLFDTSEIPDPVAEIWPMQLRTLDKEKNVRLWASAPRELSLDATLQAFRQGLKRLNRLFPFLSASLLEIDPTLNMESCYSEGQRSTTLDHLEDRSIESYGLTSFLTQTRLSSIRTLFPFLHCHLPYPVGPMLAARTLFQEWSPKKKKKQPTPTQPSPS